MTDSAPDPGSDPNTNSAIDRRLEVAGLIVAVGRETRMFDYEGKNYLPPVINKAMVECEAAFSNQDYDLSEHLAKVVRVMVARAAPRFTADPQKWLEQNHREWL